MFWDVVPTRAAITAWGQPDRAPFGAQLDASVASLGQFEELESPRLIIRTLQSRWAGLSPSGTMTLNVDLVRAPRTCIEYVVVHEICHLKHPLTRPKVPPPHAQWARRTARIPAPARRSARKLKGQSSRAGISVTALAAATSNAPKSQPGKPSSSPSPERSELR